MTWLHLIEMVGPLVDDGGGFARTLRDVLVESGLPSQGITELTDGAAPEHAIATVLGGHGRDDDRATIERLQGEVLRRWTRLAESRECRLAPGAGEWVSRRLAAGAPIAVLTSLSPSLAAAALDRVGLAALTVAHGVRGFPHPDAMLASMTATGIPKERTLVVAASPAVLLAATQAGAGEVVLLGSGSARWMELVPVTSRIATLSDLPDHS